MSASPVNSSAKGHVFFVKVTPKSKRASIEEWEEGKLKVKVVSPPEKGAANLEVIELLADALNIRKGLIRILSGETSRIKKVAVDVSVSIEKLKALGSACQGRG